MLEKNSVQRDDRKKLNQLLQGGQINDLQAAQDTVLEALEGHMDKSTFVTVVLKLFLKIGLKIPPNIQIIESSLKSEKMTNLELEILVKTLQQTGSEENYQSALQAIYYRFPQWRSPTIL